MNNRFEIMFGGTCGSHHSPLRQSLTTSFGILRGDRGIIIDNGSGVINVAPWILESGVKEIVVLQTHLHADHVCGLQNNQVLFQGRIPVNIYAPIGMYNVWDNTFNPVNWPDRPFTHSIEDFTQIKSSFTEGVSVFKLNHPGNSFGFRIQFGSKVLVIATDHEPGMANYIDGCYRQHIEGADILVADMQYLDDEYVGVCPVYGCLPTISHIGWGHGTPSLIRDQMQKCKKPPKRVFATHHDPMRSQDMLGHYLWESQKVLPGLELACDSMIIRI